MIDGTITKLGFVGLGVMGEPMCRNLTAAEGVAGLRLRPRAGAPCPAFTIWAPKIA